MMPQLDFATYPSQLFWLAFNFVLLYWLMAKLALPKLGAVIERRASSIESDLNQAAALKKEAESALEQYDRTLAEAKNRARYLIQQAQAEIGAAQTKQLAGLQEKLDRKLREAEQKLNAAKTKALTDIQPLSKDLASAMVKKLLNQAEQNGGFELPQKKEARG